ncbi:tyrosine-type recombinase/integrase [Neobacillus drentensis]|uniref:tyrosine-type recombinase/integrase n=1 Tax=Neobacillus drentensis TaxID=220684 RepID=UPI002FFE4E83
MELESVVEEYLYHCIAKGFTPKTLKNKRQDYKQLLQFLKNKRAVTELESVTVHDLKSFFREKQKDGLQATSIQSLHKMIKAFFNWCVSEEYLKENLMKFVESPKLPKKILKTFTVQQVQSMINAFSFKDYLEVRNKAMIAMMADCGLRAMEITGLKSVNVKETTILVYGKGNKERIVFISPVLKKILIRYDRLKKEYFKDEIVKSDNYFLSYLGTSLSHVALYNVVLEAGKRAGIEGVRVSPHTFRHFYSIQSLMTGKLDIYSLSRLLGHGDIGITQRYLQSLTDEQLLDKAIASSPLMNFSKKS